MARQKEREGGREREGGEREREGGERKKERKRERERERERERQTETDRRRQRDRQRGGVGGRGLQSLQLIAEQALCGHKVQSFVSDTIFAAKVIVPHLPSPRP